MSKAEAPEKLPRLIVRESSPAVFVHVEQVPSVVIEPVPDRSPVNVSLNSSAEARAGSPRHTKAQSAPKTMGKTTQRGEVRGLSRTRQTAQFVARTTRRIAMLSSPPRPLGVYHVERLRAESVPFGHRWWWHAFADEDVPLVSLRRPG